MKSQDSSNRPDKVTITIIDPVLTGTKLAIEARKRGHRTIGIINWKNQPQFVAKTFQPDLFDEIYTASSKEEMFLTLSKLQHKPTAIFPGTESAVELSELANSFCKLKSNEPATSELRRNKLLMHSALKEYGLATAEQIEAESITEIVEWVSSNKNLTWPIVLKPLASAATDGLSFSSTINELKENAERLFASSDLFGKPNKKILVQSFIEGTEYVVNTITYNKKHFVTDFWRYTKRSVNGAGRIYDRQDLLPIGKLRDGTLQDYTFRALDAIGIQHGPAHCEVMMTKDGPILVEIAARIQGGINPDVLNKCTGTNQLTLAYELAIKGKNFILPEINSEKLLSHACWINLICHSESRANKLEVFRKKISSLKSFASIYLAINENEIVKKTVDLMTSPGVVFLVNDDAKQIDRDYETIRELEKNHY